MVNNDPASQPDIDSLVNQAQRGDDGAFTALVDEYKNSIYNYVVRMLHDRTEAEDIAQETFVRAYQALPEFRGASSFQTWLYRIASNLAIDAARRRSRRSTVSLDEPVSVENSEVSRQVADKAPGPVKKLETSETQQVVREAIGELSPKLSSVIVLCDLVGLSYEEIADILGCPLGTVKSRLFNARDQLQKKLAAKLPLDELLSM